MIVKDWMLEAAKELDAEPYEDAYAGADYKREIIARHCPLKEDVAYMPVPRCDSCAHWRLIHAEAGQCRYIPLFTQADFGCVRWKEKS